MIILEIVEILFELFPILGYPGAGIRWLRHGGKIPYKELKRDEDFFYNIGALLLFLLVLALLLFLIAILPALPAFGSIEP